MKKLEKYVPIIGVASILLITLSALIFSRAEQCPTNYTQQQVDASRCVVGANIGFGIILAISTALLVTVVTLFVIKKRKPSTHTKK